MKATNFDEHFDNGGSVMPHADMSRAERPNRIKRVNVDFPVWMVEALDEEARRLETTMPQSNYSPELQEMLVRVEAALVRAGQNARRLAEQTGTTLIIRERDGGMASSQECEQDRSAPPALVKNILDRK